MDESQRKETVAKKLKETSVEFLLHEFDNLETERIRLRDEAVQRLNFFLTLTSASLGAIVLLGQPVNGIKTEYIVLIALVPLSIIGQEIYRFMISREINTDRLIRAQARIRRSFVEDDPALEKYLTWQIDDRPSKYITNNNSAVRRTAQAVLAFLISIIFGIVFNLTTNNNLIAIATSLIAFVTGMIILEKISKAKFSKATEEASNDSRFSIQPTTDS